MILVHCFCPIGLEANKCVLTPLTVETPAVDICYHGIVFFVVFSLCLKHYYYHYSTCECYVLWFFICHYNCYHGYHLDGATSYIGRAWCSSAATADAEGQKRANLVQHASPGICQLCHRFSTGKCLFWSWAFNQFTYICWYLLWCMFSAFRWYSGCHIHQWGLIHWGLQHCSSSEHTHGRNICILVMVIGPCQECTKWLLLHCFK